MSNIDVNDISSTPIDSGGVDLGTMVTVAGNIVTSFPKPPETIKDEEVYLVLVTKKGLAKKLSYKNFQKIRGTVTAIKLSDDDELVSVDVLYGKKDIIIYTYYTTLFMNLQEFFCYFEHLSCVFIIIFWAFLHFCKKYTNQFVNYSSNKVQTIDTFMVYNYNICVWILITEVKTFDRSKKSNKKIQ